MVEFIDKTTGQDGTPLNRVNMLAIQGFMTTTTTFEGGSIEQINADGHTLTTTFNNDGSITETFVGEYTVTKTTTFSGSTIQEAILS